MWKAVVRQNKDTIFWKQITTWKTMAYWKIRLFVRTKIQFFESKSQHLSRNRQRTQVVRQNKDTIFWKQITTVAHCVVNEGLLFVRTKIQFFESKSQRNPISSNAGLCCSSEQRYNFLKANHNLKLILFFLCSVVRQNKDTIFWKQITTCRNCSLIKASLFVRTKIQFFESKSQLLFLFCFCDTVVRQNKDTIFWKQITTSKKISLSLDRLFVRTKIQFFESKSQQSCVYAVLQTVVRQNKDTIFWKQITTLVKSKALTYWLFVRTKIQFFESKSQQFPNVSVSSCGCSSEQRYNFLKANHNVLLWGLRHVLVVRQNKDTIFWKQITTTAIVRPLRL